MNTLGCGLSALERTKTIRVERHEQRRYSAPFGRRAQIAAATYPLRSQQDPPSWSIGEKNNFIEAFC